MLNINFDDVRKILKLGEVEDIYIFKNLHIVDDSEDYDYYQEDPELQDKFPNKFIGKMRRLVTNEEYSELYFGKLDNKTVSEYKELPNHLYLEYPLDFDIDYNRKYDDSWVQDYLDHKVGYVWINAYSEEEYNILNRLGYKCFDDVAMPISYFGEYNLKIRRYKDLATQILMYLLVSSYFGVSRGLRAQDIGFQTLSWEIYNTSSEDEVVLVRDHGWNNDKIFIMSAENHFREPKLNPVNTGEKVIMVVNSTNPELTEYKYVKNCKVLIMRDCYHSEALLDLMSEHEFVLGRDMLYSLKESDIAFLPDSVVGNTKEIRVTREEFALFIARVSDMILRNRVPKCYRNLYKHLRVSWDNKYGHYKHQEVRNRNSFYDKFVKYKRLYRRMLMKNRILENKLMEKGVRDEE